MGATRRGATVTVLAAVLVTGCGAPDETPRRGPVALTDREVAVIGGTTLELTVSSCLGEPELSALEQNAEVVTVEVTTTLVDDGPACADVLTVELDEPLGARQVVDAVSGEPMRITRPADPPQ